MDSQGEDSPKEVVSRSGRKIKPKRFADFSSSEEADNTTEKSGTYQRLQKCFLIFINKFYTL